jgi:hypothetical protein
LFTISSLKKLFTKVGLVEWLKVKALSSNPSTAKKKKKRPKYANSHTEIVRGIKV